MQEYKKTDICVIKLWINLTNGRQNVGRDTFSEILITNPYYELLTTHSGNFSLMFETAERRLQMIRETAVQDVGLFLGTLARALEISDGDSAVITVDDSNQNFIIKHEKANAIVCRCNRIAGQNSPEDFLYSVPWEEFVMAVAKIMQNYSSLINDSKNLVFRLIEEKIENVSSNGLMLRASIDNRFPFIGEIVTIDVELNNISDEVIELVNFIQPYSACYSPMKLYLSGRDYRNNINRKSIPLKPGESIV